MQIFICGNSTDIETRINIRASRMILTFSASRGFSIHLQEKLIDLKNIYLFFLLFFYNLAFGQQDINKTQDMKTNQALLIIDIQNDYFDGGANPLAGSLEASLKAKQVLEDFRKKALPVIHIQHLSTRPGSTFFVPDTEGADIHPNVYPVAGEKVITKNYPNSFRDTELLDYLHSNTITDLVICGMMTHMCVDATVRAAKDFGLNCTVISDACATKDLEIQNKKVQAGEVQLAFIAALDYFYSTIQTVEEYLSSK